MAPENNCRVPVSLVAQGRQCSKRSTITCTKTCSADLRRMKRRVGRSLKLVHCKGNLVPSRMQVTHKLSEPKGGLPGPKRVPGPLLEQHSPHSYRQHHSGCLHKQVERERSHLGALLWRILTPALENRLFPKPDTFQAS